MQKIMYFISMVLENLALSSDDNEDLIYCLKVRASTHLLELMKCKMSMKLHKVTIYFFWGVRDGDLA